MDDQSKMADRGSVALTFIKSLLYKTTYTQFKLYRCKSAVLLSTDKRARYSLVAQNATKKSHRNLTKQTQAYDRV